MNVGATLLGWVIAYVTVRVNTSWRESETRTVGGSDTSHGGKKKKKSGKAFRDVTIVTLGVTNRHSLFNGAAVGCTLIESVICSHPVQDRPGHRHLVRGGGHRGGGLGG